MTDSEEVDVETFLTGVTAVVLTFNEAANLRRTLSRLAGVGRVVVVDSGSTDATVAIAGEYPNVEVFERRFDTHAQQWNYGLSLVRTEWVLTLDADYVLTLELEQELCELAPAADCAGYWVHFAFCIHGREIRGNLYPPRLALFRREAGVYVQDGHTQVLKLQGRAGWLGGRLRHDDRKPLSAWMQAQCRYADLEVAKLRERGAEGLGFADRVRSWIVPAPVLVCFYTLFVKGVVMDGWAGWFYAMQRVVAELVLSLRLLEERLRGGGGGEPVLVERKRGCCRGLLGWLMRVGLWLVALVLVALVASPLLLMVKQEPEKADCIVVLGGGVEDRAPLAAELYRKGWAGKVLVTGAGDSADNRRRLMREGVPGAAIWMEPRARTTRENALLSLPMLREHGVHRGLVVTTWFHSRRALACFREYAPEVEWVSVPSRHHLMGGWFPDSYAFTRVWKEYLKTVYYVVRFRVWPAGDTSGHDRRE